MATTCIWTGVSGIPYTFYVHDNPTNFDPNQFGNYIYAKISDGKWVPIYIGEGELSERCCIQHHKALCIAARGATHVHAHLNENAATRKVEERDLLARYTNAYTPFGCNEKLGG